MINIRTILWGLLQALVTVIICGLAILAFAQLQSWESCSDGYVDKIALLLLFVTSALISGTAVLARPAYLMLQQRINEGFQLLLSTIIWLVLILTCVFMGIVFLDLHTIF